MKNQNKEKNIICKISKGMNLHFKIIFYFIILLSIFTFSQNANAATLELNLEKNITSVKDDVVVLVTIDSEGQDINTAQATISFPADLLEVTKVDRVDSIFTFWLEEPIYDNAKGVITFVGGSTSGFTGPGLKLMKISFRVKGSGTGKLGITNGAITASDGTGSNVYTTAKGLDISIPSTAEFQAVKLERSVKEVTQSKKLPAVAGLSIPFYPDQAKWNNRSASFKASWNVGSDIIQAGVAVNQNPTFLPEASAEALTGNKIFSALSDGVWYLHLRFKNNVGWGPATHYRLAIDTTPPSPFKITSTDGMITSEPKPTINFISSDVTSGINNYIIRLDGVVVDTISSSTYKFLPLLPGSHQIIVVAVDKAGNSTSETENLEILPIEAPEITYVSRSVIIDEGSIVAGGTALANEQVIVQIQNAQKQIVSEQIVPVDESGNWNITIYNTFGAGNYQLLATARDNNMASSLPVLSEVIKVKQRPMLVLGSLEITQSWFFIGLIGILFVAFGAGWFGYYKWKAQLDRKVVIAQRDIVNIFDNLENDINELLKNYADGNPDEAHLIQMKTTLKSMKEDLEKSRSYVVDNIREIEE